MIRTLDSRQERQLLPFGKYGALLAWSPDAKFIYFLRQGEKPWINDVWRIAVDNAAEQRLIQNVGGMPVLSPDGLTLAFPRDFKMFLVARDGQNERLLCDPCTPSREMAWSPDGSQIAIAVSRFEERKAARSRVFLLDTHTGQVKQIAAFDGAVSGVVWRGGMGGILLNIYPYDETRMLPPGAGQIWLMALPSGERTQLTHDPPGYSELLGATSDGLTIAAVHIPPAPGYWERAALLLGFNPDANGPHGTVMLHFAR